MLTMGSWCRFDVLPSTTDPNAPLIINARHRSHLESAAKFLDAFVATRGVQDADHTLLDTTANSVRPVELRGDIVCSAEELRYAALAIGKISGSIGVEDVLDVIFRDFCIGK